jgi:hypothetical protein
MIASGFGLRASGFEVTARKMDSIESDSEQLTSEGAAVRSTIAFEPDSRQQAGPTNDRHTFVTREARARGGLVSSDLAVADSYD